MRANEVSNVILLVFLSFLHSFPTGYSLKHKYEQCEQLSPCKCIFPNGRGIELTDIDNNIKSWVQLAGGSDLSILFQPCENVKFVDNSSTGNECSEGVSVCLHNATSNSYLSLGKMQDGTFFFDKADQNIYLKFETKNRVTTIKLICHQYKVVLEGSVSSVNTYELSFQTPSACIERIIETEQKPGLSVGSLLIILFMTLMLCYFGGGMIALRLLRGAEGKELIPNYDFWAQLPYLVRDGILFTLSGFRLPTTYDRI